MLAYTLPDSYNLRVPFGNVPESVSHIEKLYPRIANELCGMWKSSQIDNYIDSLLLDDRGDRMGFPLDVLDDLMFLAGVRWYLLHLCGTVINSTSSEVFSFTGNALDRGNSDPRTWVLV